MNTAYRNKMGIPVYRFALAPHRRTASALAWVPEKRLKEWSEMVAWVIEYCDEGDYYVSKLHFEIGFFDAAMATAFRLRWE